MNTERDCNRLGSSDARAVVSCAGRLLETLGIDLSAKHADKHQRSCVVETEDGPVDILRAKIFAYTPEGMDEDTPLLILEDPQTGIIAAEMATGPVTELNLEQAQTMAGEIERRWNIYPLLVNALAELRAYAQTLSGDDRVSEITHAGDVLRRVELEEHPLAKATQ